MGTDGYLDRLDAVDRWIMGHTDELVALASRLIAFATPSPPGRNTAEAQAFLSEYLNNVGFDVRSIDVYPGDPDVVGVLPPTRSDAPSLLLNGHIDVAESGDAALWTTPPYTPVVRDGRLYGRGAADMKGALAAALMALRALHIHQVPLPGGVIVESVIGEEQGEAGTALLCEQGYRADFAVCLDCSGLALQGQGGVVTGWVTVESPETLHDGMRARVLHAGGGVEGASAIEKMMKLIVGLQELERHWAVMKQYPGFSPGTTTINPAVIRGGRHPAFLADRCELWITVHFYPNETAESVAAEIEDHLRRVASADLWLRQHPPTFRWGGRSMLEEAGEVFPPAPLVANHPAFRLLAATHRTVTGAAPTIGMSPTVTDAGWLAAAGIPTVIYGPGELSQAHTVNESVAVADLLAACRVLARFAATWSAGVRS
jgi:acetylornithine deacetylase